MGQGEELNVKKFSVTSSFLKYLLKLHKQDTMLVPIDRDYDWKKIFTIK